jgi:hypothetical protein
MCITSKEGHNSTLFFLILSLMESVTINLIIEIFQFSQASPDKMACVQIALTLNAPFPSLNLFSPKCLRYQSCHLAQHFTFTHQLIPWLLILAAFLFVTDNTSDSKT